MPSSPGTMHSTPASTSMAVSWACEHLGLALIDAVHVSARCVLRPLSLCFPPFQLMSSFMRMLYFWYLKGPAIQREKGAETSDWHLLDACVMLLWLAMLLPATQSSKQIRWQCVARKYWALGGDGRRAKRSSWLVIWSLWVSFSSAHVLSHPVLPHWYSCVSQVNGYNGLF